MRALVYDGPHRFHLEDRPDPEPGPGEARIRIGAVGICGSDLHGYTGESGRRKPGMVMGHEAAGWVDRLGPGVEGVALGQAVTFNPALPCDGNCGHAAENTCSQLRVIGVTPELQGAFADYVVVPVARLQPLGTIALDVAAAIEPAAVGLQAVRQADVRTDDRVLIVGGGMIGQCVALAARLAGAGSIVVSDPVASRREIAARAGFGVVDPGDGTALTGFDRAVDAVGISATAATAVSALRLGGTACFVGLGSPRVEVPLFDIVVGERRVVGSFAYPDAAFREAAALVADGTLDVAPLLGQTRSLEEAPAAFADLASGQSQDVKITVMVAGAPS